MLTEKEMVVEMLKLKKKTMHIMTIFCRKLWLVDTMYGIVSIRHFQLEKIQFYPVID